MKIGLTRFAVLVAFGFGVASVFADTERWANHPATPARHTVHSPDGRFRLEVVYEEVGCDDFSVAELSLWEEDSLRWRADNPSGNGFYISDLGAVAAVEALEAFPEQTRVHLYDVGGDRVIAVDVPFAHGFRFARDTDAFSVCGLAESLVLDTGTGSVWRYPAQDRIVLSERGDLVAGARGGTVTVWRGTRQERQWFVQDTPIRDLAVSDSMETVRVTTGQHFGLLDVASGRAIYEPAPPSGGAIRLPALKPLSSSSAADLSGRREIGWPLPPFDSTYAIGNSYEAYMFFRHPYLHPGIDVMAPEGTPVHAVTGGVVKAVLTTLADRHWRVAVADSATADSTEGWMYAHLAPESITVDVGDTVRQGDLLGSLVAWPSANFHHLHLVKVRQAGEVWEPDWDALFNPLDVLHPREDTDTPEFEPIPLPVSPEGQFGYCLDETSQYLSPDHLYGNVDIIARVGDRIGDADWKCSVYELRYWLEDAMTDRVVVGPILAAHLSHELPRYLGTAELTDVLYKDDGVLDSRNGFGGRDYYHIVTNTDGDVFLELSDAEGALQTTALPDGPYRVVVEAKDAAGNTAMATELVTIRNDATLVSRPPETGTPASFELRLPSPNPFNANVTFECALPGASTASLEIRDTSGGLVRRVDIPGVSGLRRWKWDGRGPDGREVASGMYIATLRYGSGARTRKVALLR